MSNQTNQLDALEAALEAQNITYRIDKARFDHEFQSTTVKIEIHDTGEL